MDFSAILGLLPYIMQGIQLAQTINQQKTDGTKIMDIVKGELPQVLDLFTGVGKTLFPNLTQASQVAAATVVLDPTTTKKVQGQLNKLGATLTVDGSYGPLTKAAVSAFQSANPPLVADGWAGKLTQAALDAKTV